MKKILLIEDHDEVRENITEILELSKYKVISAENGKKGVELALQEAPDLILCDIMMPEMDGYAVLHTLNKYEQTNQIPFIFLTAKSEKGDIRKGMQMGADDYLTKPFDGGELLSAIEIRLKKSRLLQKEFTNTHEGITEFFNLAQETGQIPLTSAERETIHYKKKHRLYSIGQRPVNLYFVISGKLKSFKTHDDGKELITCMYGPGDFIGYTALLEGTNYSENTEVLQEADLMLIPKQEFLDLINHDPQISKQFIKLLTFNLQERERKLLNLAYNSLRKRVAVGLLQVIDKFKTVKGPANIIEISRENLANVIGSATESLIRTLSDFKNENLIEISEGKIYIINELKLRALIN